MIRPRAEELLRALEGDSLERLKWRVLALLGVCPLSLRARLTTKREVLRCACHLALDAGARSPETERHGAKNENPNFDMARYAALGGLSDGI